MAEYNSAYDAACCGGPTLHRWTPYPATEECVVCKRRMQCWPEDVKPCEQAKQCEDFEEFSTENNSDDWKFV